MRWGRRHTRRIAYRKVVSRCRWAASRASPLGACVCVPGVPVQAVIVRNATSHAAGQAANSLDCLPQKGGPAPEWQITRVSRASPWSVRMRVRCAGASGHGVRWHSPCGGAGSGVQIIGRFQATWGFPRLNPPAQGHKNSACRMGTDAVRFQVMPRGLPGAGGPY